MPRSSAILAPLMKKIEGIFTLTNDEHLALSSLPVRLASLEKGQTVVQEGDRPTRCCLVLSGVTCMFKFSGEGQREILMLHLPGDVPDLMSLHLNELDMGIAALAASKVAFIAHEDIRKLYRDFPRLGDALWRATLVDAAILREWLLNIGRRSAQARTAHLLCEVMVRMKLAGAGADGVFPLPLTQQEIADATGLSPIHINRIIHRLRDDGLIELARGRIMAPDWDQLVKVADFNLTYLHLTAAQKALL